MSQFWRALEQAKRDRALQSPETAPPEPEPTIVAGAERVAATLPPVAEPEPPVPVVARAERVAPPPTVEPPIVTRPPVSAVPSNGDSPFRGRLEVTPPVMEPLNKIDDHLVSLMAPASFIAEQYRALRHIIEEAHLENALSVLAVSSPSVGDGKTTTAINLAGALSQARDPRVLLIDIDVRRPALGKRLGLPDHQPGLVDAILDSRLDLAAVAKTVRPFNFSVVLGGQPTKAPYELLKAKRLATLLEAARDSYDYVILDAPPLLPMPDCQMIGALVDKFVVVLACDKTPRRLLAEGLNMLAPDRILGLVFNRNDQVLSDYRLEDYGQAERGAGWSRAARRIRPFQGAKTRSSDLR